MQISAFEMKVRFSDGPISEKSHQGFAKAAGKNLAQFLGISAIALLLAPSALLPIKATAQEIQRDSASVIMYHRFGEDRYPSTNIRLSQFEEHLELLTNGDYTVLPCRKSLKPCALAAPCQIVLSQ